MDTDQYLLPQRRNRVWGMASLLGCKRQEEIQEAFSASLAEMATSAKLPDQRSCQTKRYLSRLRHKTSKKVVTGSFWIKGWKRLGHMSSLTRLLALPAKWRIAVAYLVLRRRVQCTRRNTSAIWVRRTSCKPKASFQDPTNQRCTHACAQSLD